MTTWLLLTLLTATLFGVCLFALSLRARLGLAPLMLVMGALEGLKTYVLTGTVIELAGVGPVRLGSVVSYMNALAVVQVLYLRSGLAAARELVWSLVCVALALALLNPLTAWLLQQPGVVEPLPVNPAALAGSGRIEVVGNALLLAGLLMGVVLVNALQRIGTGRWLSLFATLVVVSTADTLLFITLAFGPSALEFGTVVPAITGKAAAALLLASLGYAYLRNDHASNGSFASERPLGSQLWAALSFRGRIADLEQQLQTDPLTGVFNRRYLDQTVPELLHFDQVRGLPTSLILLDLDHFKQINERHGHLVGDQALQHAAQVLQHRLRRNDVVLRYGGEEFLLVLPCTGKSEAEHLAELVLEALIEQPLLRGDGPPLVISATLGISSSPNDGDTLRTLIERADSRLRTGKRSGRSRVISTDAS